MKCQVLIVVAILFNLFFSHSEAQEPVHTTDLKNVSGAAPAKKDIERELTRYNELVRKAEEKNDLDPNMLGLWSTTAKTLETGMAMSAEQYRTEGLANSYQTLFYLNRTAERNLTDADRLLVLECCHRIKEGKVCDSLHDDRKKDLKKCRAAHRQ